ncbi:DUF3425 domain-containing protein [Aspergillus brunneoviolaceus CBS 621.78]|uniref:Uncharacterized protein n=1 Tax=Aspergillus brunneoviolaceus CBS 621.78 TaxID=1450534 RepID=A0ACD1GHT2_9EURO|nr:hypothetical protein BO95DRAFT_429007 [Aspergillus brunneoviolaceus CBS 621.78]RAH48782.1 hypothetical protein BO95DRAFT_429007 [Aspergillus brunneoviolaceus CBS 621.78]
MNQLVSMVTAHANLMCGSPLRDLRFSITRLNVLRALFFNLEVLGYSPSDIHDDAQSTFTPNIQSGIKWSRIEALPTALRPTVIQRTVPHHPWLDLMPFPRMRDTLILAQAYMGDEQLCHDLCGNRVPCAGCRDLSRPGGIGETGVLVWRDPWDPSGWEVTETFARSWGWVLQDCVDLFNSTNAWRIERGERPLFRSAFGIDKNAKV